MDKLNLQVSGGSTLILGKEFQWDGAALALTHNGISIAVIDGEGDEGERIITIDKRRAKLVTVSESETALILRLETPITEGDLEHP